MLISIWWVVAAFVVGGSLGMFGLALLSSRAPDSDPIAYGDLETTR